MILSKNVPQPDVNLRPAKPSLEDGSTKKGGASGERSLIARTTKLADDECDDRNDKHDTDGANPEDLGG